jgi:hypothetical protein
MQSYFSHFCSFLLWTLLLSFSKPVVMYECKTLSLSLKEEHRPRVFENKALRRIFGPRRDEVTGG